MNGRPLRSETVEELVSRFVEIGVAQGAALDRFDSASFNRRIGVLIAVEDELKKRDHSRSALVALLDHPNLQVRLNAAKATLAIAPEKARLVLKGIQATHRMPQAADAAGCLRNLEQGIFKPT